MKSFLKVEKDIYFSSCDTCEAKCCDGRHGSIFSQIILDDFEKVNKYFPILFTFGDLGYLKAIILLSNGKDFCPYIKDFKCTIYDKRPTICKAYPLSTNIDNLIYYDINCPGISENGYDLVKNNKVSPHFDSYIFNDYQTKYINTHLELEKFNKKEDFVEVTSINGNSFYKFIKKSDNPYMQMHQESLINLKNYNL